MLVPKTHQLRKDFSKNLPTAIHSHCSWWVFRTCTLQLVGYCNKHWAVSGFFERALCCWWTFIRRGRQSRDKYSTSDLSAIWVFVQEYFYRHRCKWVGWSEQYSTAVAMIDTHMIELEWCLCCDKHNFGLCTWFKSFHATLAWLLRALTWKHMTKSGYKPMLPRHVHTALCHNCAPYLARR